MNARDSSFASPAVLFLPAFGASVVCFAAIAICKSMVYSLSRCAPRVVPLIAKTIKFIIEFHQKTQSHKCRRVCEFDRHDRPSAMNIYLIIIRSIYYSLCSIIAQPCHTSSDDNSESLFQWKYIFIARISRKRLRSCIASEIEYGVAWTYGDGW